MSDLKNRKRITTTLPLDLIEKLKQKSKETLIPMSKLIEQAIQDRLR